MRSGAGGILSASASVSASASLGQSADGAGDGSVPAEAEKIVIPKKMQAGFAALIANARKVTSFGGLPLGCWGLY